MAGLSISSYFVPVENGGEDWIPLLGGFADLTAFNSNLLLRGVLGGVFNVFTATSLLVINTKSVNNVFNPSFSVLFFLLVVLLNPSAVYFSWIHPAVLLFIWGQYFFVTDRKFASMFLTSCAALFYAPLIWALPLVLIISIFGAGDILRTSLKSLGGILLPFLYVLCFRYIAFDDAAVFIDEYMAQSMAFSSPLQESSIPGAFMILCLAAVSLHALSYMFRKLYSNSIVTEHILKMEFLSLILGVALYFIFCGNGSVPVNMVVALPLGILLSHYFTGNITAAPARIELILLCCATVISRLYHFI